uniref:Fungal specific transcription factor n=1 Tax=Colletotrichum fructicola (strain Nara gc5) TaxID=1213859 RepID=L2G9D4_COLFN
MPQQIFGGFFHNAFVNVYYPSQHFPDLSAADVRALARHAAESVACYKNSFRSRELRFYWRCIHSLFKAGVALVYCIRVAATLPQQQQGEGEEMNVPNLVDTVNDCSSIIWAMVERYPQGQAYRDVFESLVNSVLGKDGGDQVQQQQQQQPSLVQQQQASAGDVQEHSGLVFCGGFGGYGSAVYRDRGAVLGVCAAVSCWVRLIGS